MDMIKELRKLSELMKKDLEAMNVEKNRVLEEYMDTVNHDQQNILAANNMNLITNIYKTELYLEKIESVIDRFESGKYLHIFVNRFTDIEIPIEAIKEEII